MKIILIQIIKLYQKIVSPLLGNRCRFYPVCSNYAIEAIQKHGCGYGVWFTMRRLLKCHPGSDGGIDPVP